MSSSLSRCGLRCDPRADEQSIGFEGAAKGVIGWHDVVANGRDLRWANGQHCQNALDDFPARTRNLERSVPPRWQGPACAKLLLVTHSVCGVCGWSSPYSLPALSKSTSVSTASWPRSSVRVSTSASPSSHAEAPAHHEHKGHQVGLLLSSNGSHHSLECFTAHHCRHQLARVISETRVHHDGDMKKNVRSARHPRLGYQKSDQFSVRHGPSSHCPSLTLSWPLPLLASRW